MTLKLLETIKGIEDTHRGLGRLVGMTLVNALAKKTTLVISPSGCGKSASLKSVIGATKTPYEFLIVLVFRDWKTYRCG